MSCITIHGWLEMESHLIDNHDADELLVTMLDADEARRMHDLLHRDPREMTDHFHPELEAP